MMITFREINKKWKFIYDTTILRKRFCDQNNHISEGNSEENFNNNNKIPPEPTNCCMSGCANCVWIQYAEELIKVFGNSSEKARNIILEKITDPNMKAFLSMELRNLESKLEDTTKKDE